MDQETPPGIKHVPGSRKDRSTPQYRGGEGRVVSSSDVKGEMGRTSFQRVAKDHVGERSNSTEWLASRRLEKGRPQQGPTKTEMDMVFADNPSAVRTYKAAGMNDREIYDLLKDK